MTTPLLEPFKNLTNWTSLGGLPTITTGRTGLGASFTPSSGEIRYLIPSGDQQAAVIVGFAFKTTAYPASTRQVVWLYSDSDVTQHTGVRIGINGELIAQRSSTIVIGTSANGVIPVNTWCYVEARFVLGDVPNGVATLRVNGTQVLNLTSVDTKNAGTKTVYDSVHIYGPTGLTFSFDDLYVACGTAEPFKGDITIPEGVNAKTWSGSAFVDSPVKTWSGSAFVDAAAIKTWNGSAFV